MSLVIAIAAGYLLGSIPFGLILTRVAGLGDIRKVGSGNIGATNVLRTGKRGLAFATLLLDGAKGALAIALAAWLSPEAATVAAAAGAAAVIGHVFPVWLGGKGGKGVATMLGFWLAISWPVGIFACAAWLAVAALFRFSSLAALIALCLAPLAAWMLGQDAAAFAGAVLAGLVVLRHRENIRRLFAGTEPRIKLSKPSLTPAR